MAILDYDTTPAHGADTDGGGASDGQEVFVDYTNPNDAGDDFV